jgi:myo-inositol-1(or 4)-monophosphatase
MFAPSAELTSMISAARRSGAVLMGHFRGPARAALEVRLKGPADFVSTADLESERTLREALLGAYPRFGFVAEESAATQGSDVEGSRFIVDPLDGTTNFLHGVPHFAVSIALEHAGRLVAGVVYDPAKDELFCADAGRGAWLGTDQICVSKEDDLAMAIVGTGIPHNNRPERHEQYLAMLSGAMRGSAGIRRFAAAALDLCYVAAGRLEAFFEMGLSPWDVAAGALIVREAGGRVTEPSGGEDVVRSGDVLATNGRLHARMQELLRAGASAAAG